MTRSVLTDRRARHLSLVPVLLGVIGSGVLIVALTSAADAVAFHRLTTGSYLIAQAVGVLSLFCVLRAVHTGWRLARRAQRWRAGTVVVGGTCRHGHPVDIIDDPRPVACTVGLLRPRIVISDGVIALLGPNELRAVIAHEAEHARRRDPLRLLLAASVHAAFAFFPGARQVRDRHAALLEVAADQRAERSSTRHALAGALLAFSDGQRPTVANERVDRLCGRRTRLGLARRDVAGDAVLVIALAAVVLGLLDQTGCIALLETASSCATVPGGASLGWITIPGLALSAAIIAPLTTRRRQST